MKTRQSIIILLTTAAAFAGCAKTSVPQTPLDNVVRVTADVSARTKGSCTGERLESFDLFVKSASVKYNYDNTKFTKNSSTGEWEPERQMLWEGDSTPFTFLAVSPVLSTRDCSIPDDLDEPVFNFSVETNQTLESTASDLLLCSKGNVTRNGNTLDFDDAGRLKVAFRHTMSLLKVEITFGTEFNHNGVPATNPASDLIVNGFNGDAAVKMTDSGDWSISAIDDTRKAIQACESVWAPANDKDGNCKATFECIVVPQSMTSFTLSFVASENPYTYTTNFAPGFSFQSGKEYVLPLVVGKDEVHLSEDISAKAWISAGDSKDLETD